MSSRRSQIVMTAEELKAYLAEQRTLIVATTGRDERPHLTALWYVVRDGHLWIFTYARSQKVKNLERIPQATLLVESGREYTELRGAMIYAEATVHRDPEVVQEVGEQIFVRYSGSALDEAARGAVRRQAAKRVAVEFTPTRVVSWDHAKLAGPPAPERSR